MRVGNEQDTLASLRDANTAGVDESVRPAVAKALKFVDEVTHRGALVQDKHVADILQDEPPRTRPLKQPEHLAHQARAFPADACRCDPLATGPGTESLQSPHRPGAAP